jgi:preprotein translocase subunit SecG
METVTLVILLILALALIAVVLLQRSEGGGLGMGAGGVMSGRGQATALGRVTWWLGGGFMLASLALTAIAARDAAGRSVVDQGGAVETDLDAGSLLPPPADAPLVPVDPSAELVPEATPDPAPTRPPSPRPRSPRTWARLWTPGPRRSPRQTETRGAPGPRLVGAGPLTPVGR